MALTKKEQAEFERLKLQGKDSIDKLMLLNMKYNGNLRHPSLVKALQRSIDITKRLAELQAKERDGH